MRTQLLLTLSATLVACGGNDGRTSGSSGITSTGTETETGTGTATETTGSGTATGGCPAVQVCANQTCCPDGQVCDGGVCVADCGGEPACGQAQVCCAGAEICYAGSCIEPGRTCSAGACATKADEGCADDEVCEPVLGQCVPKVANEQCIYMPPPATFDPIPRFTWGERRVVACTMDTDCQYAETCVNDVCTVGWSHVGIAMDDEPMHTQSSSIAAVADLDGDCVPEIIFNTYANSVFTSDGILRAIRGDDGSKVWTVTDANFRTDGSSNIAVGDITGDGRPDVVAIGETKYLIAIDSGGSPLWVSDSFVGAEGSGSVAIANLDGEGLPEIVVGAAVFDNTGKLLWEGTNGIGIAGQGPISCIADLDGDLRPELIGGKTAYSFTGTVATNTFAGQVFWDTTLADGYCGVADFDQNGDPEIVLVQGGTVRLLDGIDGAELASIAIPGGGNGGAPNIADFDGDGKPEVGVAGGVNYIVADFEAGAFSISRQATTEDDSSNRTGSSVFDFDGDGRAEVVYNDEEFVRIYPGTEPDCELMVPGPGCDGIMTDAEVLFKDFNSSRTRTEYPVIADVDGDFKAEIIFVTNNEASFLAPENTFDAGIEVWEDKLDNWMPTRPIWNQHSYHIDNVTDDGQIPTAESNSWESHNSYRRNTQGDVEFCAPDLVPLDLQADFFECPNLSLSVWVKNQGCLGVGAGVEVAFYEETLGLLGVVSTTGALVPGAAEKVSLTYPLMEMGSWKVWAVVDDNGGGIGVLNECDEANNEHVPIDACKMVG